MSVSQQMPWYQRRNPQLLVQHQCISVRDIPSRIAGSRTCRCSNAYRESAYRSWKARASRDRVKRRNPACTRGYWSSKICRSGAGGNGTWEMRRERGRYWDWAHTSIALLANSITNKAERANRGHSQANIIWTKSGTADVDLVVHFRSRIFILAVQIAIDDPVSNSAIGTGPPLSDQVAVPVVFILAGGAAHVGADRVIELKGLAALGIGMKIDFPF